MLNETSKELIKSMVVPRIGHELIDEKIDNLDRMLELSKYCPSQAELGGRIAKTLNNFQGLNFNIDEIDYIEQFLKLNLFLRDEEEYNKATKEGWTLRPYYEYFDIIDPNDKLWFDIAGKKVSKIHYLDSNNPLQKYKGHYKYNYIICYVIRNMESHDKLLFDPAFKLEVLINYLISFLEISWESKKAIMNKYVFSNVDFGPYVDNIIKEYESRTNYKYIHSSVKLFDKGEYEDVDVDDKSIIDIVKSKKYRKIKLIGYAGAGKTSTIMELAYLSALNCQKNDYKSNIPIVIPLNSVPDTITEVETILMEKLKINDREILDYLINERKVNLYFDGVNEMSFNNFGKIKRALDIIEIFIENINCNVIVTDRDSNEYSILNNELTFIIDLIKEEQIKEFILGNSKNGEETLKLIQDALVDNEYLNEQVHKPFMLKRLIDTVEIKGIIPTSVNELNGIYIESLIEREIKEKKDPNARYINKLLMYLAFFKNQNSENMNSLFIYDTFDKCMERFKFEVDKEKILILVCNMNLLIKVNTETYAFAEDFWSYYCSLAVEAIDQGVEL